MTSSILAEITLYDITLQFHIFVHTELWILCAPSSSVHNVHNTVYTCTQYSIHNVHNTVYTMYAIQCTQYSAHSVHNNKTGHRFAQTKYLLFEHTRFMMMSSLLELACRVWYTTSKEYHLNDIKWNHCSELPTHNYTVYTVCTLYKVIVCVLLKSCL